MRLKLEVPSRTIGFNRVLEVSRAFGDGVHCHCVRGCVCLALPTARQHVAASQLTRRCTNDAVRAAP
eukprot:6181948-Pleurochrysis_carterae.AAC.4